MLEEYVAAIPYKGVIVLVIMLLFTLKAFFPPITIPAIARPSIRRKNMPIPPLRPSMPDHRLFMRHRAKDRPGSPVRRPQAFEDGKNT